MRAFREYRVWQMAHEVTLQVYRETERFPKHELFGLTSQMRRAASSVPMNIVEGSVKSDGECQQALRIALGSASELDYQVLLAHNLGYLNDAAYDELNAAISSVKRMLIRFVATVRPAASRDPAGTPAGNEHDQRPMASQRQAQP